MTVIPLKCNNFDITKHDLLINNLKYPYICLFGTQLGQNWEKRSQPSCFGIV